ncbi:hypothetical protein [Sphingomonas montana]|uniref:hypothetical protein n=1 Tax=Sphingomonas montana TaxID=1843236 RepID=UPI00096C644F|nr:hypothetical protein [Sphingomonas montana]
MTIRSTDGGKPITGPRPRWQSAVVCGALLATEVVAGQGVHAQTAGVKAVSAAIPSVSLDRRTVMIGSDLYPRISAPSDQARYDPASIMIANTVGAKTGLFGAAAREGLTWANRYVPGTDLPGIVQLYSLSTSGNYGGFFGARSSDNTSQRSENVIGSISLVVADSDRPHLHWAHYSEGYVPRGKTAFRLLINDENSIQNEGSPAPSADPYDFNPQHLLNNMRLDCGIGTSGAQSCTNPLSILNNGARYRAGIIFGDNSIELRDGAAAAIAFPAGYGMSWFGSAGVQTWRLFATARAADAGTVRLADDAFSVTVGRTTTPALRVEKGAIRTPAVIAAGTVPVMGGTCPVRDQRGGNTAGTFVLAGDCAGNTIVIGLSDSAPNGWTCFASDMTRGEATLRETSYSRTSATIAVARARRSDSIVFSCTGF